MIQGDIVESRQSEMPDSRGPFYIEFGDVWRRGSAPLPGLPQSPDHVCDGTGELAVLFDSEDGTLHKVGEAGAVHDRASTMRKKLVDAGMDELSAGLVVISLPVREETVELVNKCVEITGFCLKLEDELSRLSADEQPLL